MEPVVPFENSVKGRTSLEEKKKSNENSYHQMLMQEEGEGGTGARREAMKHA